MENYAYVRNEESLFAKKFPYRFLKASAFNLTESNTLPWVFFTFSKLQKWYQIVRSISTIIMMNTIITQSVKINVINLIFFIHSLRSYPYSELTLIPVWSDVFLISSFIPTVALKVKLKN